MKPLLRCKSCGFVTTEDKLGEVCPACGVPRKMFEPFIPSLSEKRLRILKADVHPIVVHFPQAYAFTLLVLAGLLFFASGTSRLYVAQSFDLLALCLPFVVAGGLLSGLLDGKTRFRRLTTPILRKKIILGSCFLVFALALFIITQLGQGSPAHTAWVLLLLAAASFACSFRLGLLGASLTESKLPG